MVYELGDRSQSLGSRMSRHHLLELSCERLPSTDEAVSLTVGSRNRWTGKLLDIVASYLTAVQNDFFK